MKKEEKTLQEFLESIPALEKSELGVLRGGFSTMPLTSINSTNGTNQNCECGLENQGCHLNVNCGCGTGMNVNCNCLTPYGRSIDPSISDYSLSMSFI